MAKPTVANYRPPDISFAVRLLRQARNLTQQQLAARLATSPQYINRLERRQVMPRVTTLPRLAAALHVSPCVLITLAQCG